MDKNRLSELIRDASKLNLRYGATLLNLSKDYLKAFGDVVVKEPSARDVTGENNDNTSPTEASKRVPLLIAGRSGEIANAAVSVNNTSGMKGTVSLCVQGDFNGTRVEADPEKITFDIGEEVVIRVLAHIDDNLKLDQSYSGNVIIPELGLKVTDFVLKRLPDLKAKPKPGPKVKKATRSRKKSKPKARVSKPRSS